MEIEGAEQKLGGGAGSIVQAEDTAGLVTQEDVQSRFERREIA
jgi:hypothetical protein